MIEAFFGFPLAATALYFGFALALSIIDFRTLQLPDQLTFPLLWSGLVFHCTIDPCSVNNAIYGAISGYLTLWLVFQLFRISTGKEGLGYGDFKLLAAIGAWNGWQSLPIILIAASVLGIVFSGTISLLQHRLISKIPFGPWLAAAGWGEFFWKTVLRT